jgi:hypothetical protein
MYAKQPIAYLHVLPAIISGGIGVLFTDIHRATSETRQVSHLDYFLEMMPLFVAGVVVYFCLLAVNLVDLKWLYRRDWERQLLGRVRAPLSYFIFLMRIALLSGFTAINCLLLFATVANLHMSTDNLTAWCIALMLIISAGHMIAERKQLGVQAWEL